MAQQIPPIGEQIIYLSRIKDWPQSTMITKKRGVERDIYVFDVLDLADVADPNTDPNSDNYADKWDPIWVSGYSDNAGDNVFQPLSSAFPINFYNHPVASEQVYTAKFNFAPIVAQTTTDGDTSRNQLPYSENSPTWKAENTLWYACCFPALPLLIGSTIPSHQHYGPIFLKRASFNVSGEGEVQAVEVNADFIGGKIVLPPTISGLVNDEDYQKVYRQANFSDCMVATGLTTNTKEFLESMRQAYTSDELASYRIVGMSLDIDQEYGLSFPCHPFLTDSDGARFIALTKREVKGSLTYFSRQSEGVMPTTTQLTMFFGGPYTFPMPYVEWQNPTMTTKVKKGYLHTIKFIARSAPNAVLQAFREGTENKVVSEFNVKAQMDE